MGFFMPKIYIKPPLSVDEQIQLLSSRGLIIEDVAKAHHYLSSISYYRLSGYAFIYEGHENGKRNHQFKAGTTFENIIELYNFDRLLRLLVMDALERIEVAVRTQICLTLAVTYQDSHWYMRQELYKNKFNFEAFLDACSKNFSKSSETFVSHYKNNYSDPQLPPCWMLIELLPLGTWSTLYQNLGRKRNTRIFNAD